ncbi:hypothetical protein Tco_0677460 [Tanacetum coccineum]|uniref:Integrase, catalytic region, zinc finger, CCHC-type, peptidase aspartic, catalytic n=1 Tax=Tanacetum coccineum TaxID=301880 RepID=A0ABQ4XDK1_9ASTR
MLLTQLQEAGIQLSKDQLTILADTKERIDYGPGAFTVTTNALFQADEVEVYDSDCDDVPNAQPSFMANISSYGLDALAEVHNPDNVDNNMINHGVQVKLSSKQSSVVNHSETEITSDSNSIPYSYVNDSLTAELERYKEKVNVLKEGQNVDLKRKDNVSDSYNSSSVFNLFYLKKAQQINPMLYDGKVIQETNVKYDSNVILIPDSEETLILEEESRSKILLKQSDPMVLEKKVNTKPVDYAVLNKLSEDFGKRFVPQTELSAEQAFWSQNSMNSSEPIPSCTPTKVEVPKELLKVKRTTATAITEGTWGFEHTKAYFRDEIIPFVKALKDIFNKFNQYLIDELTEVQNVFNQMEQAVEQHRLESKTFEVKMNQVLNENDRILEQVINKDIVNIVVNSSIDNAFFDTQFNQEIFQRDNSVSNQSALNFDQYFELNELKAQSQEKDTVIRKLKERIQSLSGNVNEENVKKDIDEIESINIELEHSVEKLISENENLRNEREHLKSIFKVQFDSIKKTRVQSKEHSDSLIAQINAKFVENSYLNAQLQEKVFIITALKEELRKLKGKSVVDCSESVNKPNVIALIQELLVYVSDTCPSYPLKSEKLVVVTPMNKARKVTFAKNSTTSDNNTQIQVDVHQTQTTNKPLVPSINEKCSTNASRSKPRSETKNNRIMQPLRSNQKYQKIEAHTRNAKPSLTKEDSESKSVCLTCHKFYFDASHDLCVVQYLSEVNDRARAKAVKSINMKEWKPTGKMFKIFRYKWVPTGRTFTIDGTKCPLTRFTSTKIVPPRKPVKSTVKTNIKPSSASQWRPKETNHTSSTPKIVESRTVNHLEPNNRTGSNVSISPCSSSVQCVSYKSLQEIFESTQERIAGSGEAKTTSYERLRGRPTAATKNHMILSYDVLIIQNRRDLPKDIPLDSVVVLRYEKSSKSENKGKVPTEMEPVLEQTQQGTSYEVSVSIEGVEE